LKKVRSLNKLKKGEFMKELFKKIALFSKKQKTAIATGALAVAMAFPALAETTTSLEFDFDSSEMFTWTNTMLSALMPVLYITLGISLAFIIINALKYAFR
jgi:hypothetical protein